MHPLTAAMLLASPFAAAQGMYSKNSPVLQLDSKSYDKLIARSNYTSIVEFYAPWCGHCKNLKPAYEKAAKSLTGIAHVAAVDCDDASNKPFCSSMGVQGFPTLKLVKPSKQPGKKGTVEDYQGARDAKAITAAVTDKIANYVMRLKTSSDFEKFVAKTPDRPKGLVFSEKGLVPAFVKTLAIDFLGGVDFGYVRRGDNELVSKFGVKDFPSVLLLPNGDESEPVVFEGEVSKTNLVEFLGRVMPPHPDALPPSERMASSSKSSKPKSSKVKPKAAEETLEEDSYPQVPKESPDPDVSGDQPKPVQVPLGSRQKAEITKIADPNALQKSCLHEKATTCLIAVTPAGDSEEAGSLVETLGEVAGKHISHGAKLFPMYSVPEDNVEYKSLADGLKLPEGPQLVAVNAKRGWWTGMDPKDTSSNAIESWIDGIKLGDFKKEKLPQGLVKELKEEPSSRSEESKTSEAIAEETEHDEL